MIFFYGTGAFFPHFHIFLFEMCTFCFINSISTMSCIDNIYLTNGMFNRGYKKKAITN